MIRSLSFWINKNVRRENFIVLKRWTKISTSTDVKCVKYSLNVRSLEHKSGEVLLNMERKEFASTFKTILKEQPEIGKRTRYLCIRFLLVLFFAISYSTFGGIVMKYVEGDQDASVKCGRACYYSYWFQIASEYTSFYRDIMLVISFEASAISYLKINLRC